jgi:hypothetical protein
MAKKSSSGWVWGAIVVALLYALLGRDRPKEVLREPIRIEKTAPVRSLAEVPAPPKLDSAQVLAAAKQELLLTHTGKYRSRDIHARVLALLETIPEGAPEATEARELRSGILAAYRSRTPNEASSLAAQRAPSTSGARRAAGIAGFGNTPTSEQAARTEVYTDDALQRYLASRAAAPPIEGGSKVSAPPPRAPYQPGCAENGSCYGDISVATGRPKMTHVRGYYRRDGTYVRGHYRSK